MLVSHSRVKSIAWGISTNGIAVSFATPAAAMNDGRPGSVARFLWPAHASPNDAWVQIEGTWSPARIALFFGLINISMLQGTTVEVSFRRATTGLWDTPAGTVYVEALASGARVAYCSLPDLGRIYSGIRIKLYAFNAVFGSASIFAGTPVDIGEVWLGELQDIPIKNDWSCVPEDPTVSRDSEWLQPWVRRGTPRRVLTFTPEIRHLDGIYGPRQGLGTSVASSALEKIQTRFDRGQQVVCVPRWTPGEYALMARSAIFGTATRLGGYRHLRGGWFDPGTFTIREAPIPV